MKLYNSLTKKVEELTPLHPNHIGFYSCGPTVYDRVHIGNLRTYIFEDTLRRILKYSGLKVQHVMNITDIEDKILTRAQQAYPNEPVSQSFQKLTAQYEKLFFEDVKRVGIDLADTTIVRATEAITEMQQLIRKIPNKYLAEDGIYFDISEYPAYGVFGQLDQTHEHHRINNDEYDKEHVADFALWKAHKDGEPSWDFEIEDRNLAGRPGWHIECSAMCTKQLGQPFDIHTGGVDLKFPHHENEIAQSKSANRKSLAQMFVHAEHLLVDGKKMSKSLHNFYTLEDIVAKDYDPLAFRLLILQAHYRSQLNFSWESLTAAQNYLDGLGAWADLRYQGWVDKPYAGFDEHWQQALKQMQTALEADLNTPKALAILSELVDWLTDHGIPKADSQHSAGALKQIDAMLGLNLANRPDITKEQKQLIAQREAVRKNKDFTKSDQIRQELEKQGIGLNDTVHGVTWHRLT